MAVATTHEQAPALPSKALLYRTFTLYKTSDRSKQAEPLRCWVRLREPIEVAPFLFMHLLASSHSSEIRVALTTVRRRYRYRIRLGEVLDATQWAGHLIIPAALRVSESGTVSAVLVTLSPPAHDDNA